MKIAYRLNVPLAAQQVAELFRASGIRRPVDDLERIQKMTKNANLTLTAWEGEKLVGIARALTDFSYCCYLSDLAVHRDYQRRGIGKELVQRMHEILGDEVMILLLAAPEAMEYYPKIGFEKAENAWKVPRKR
ncbi:GNAT family N-acetyltransferase [Candidatus Acetothermia bacterium]|jgi:predicted N-acetyltransferase YhbS|nr:GNAT family N-acetyltransferase [Candidatus Acetothermia bacterium]MCI2431893.1 GNAT family N-acetyltransferase [Candidatus Acetothermia bacterium]MCI2437374.1 GNAT family N-acetyltransferase [Candidatus Acetothermia bacterium]